MCRRDDRATDLLASKVHDLRAIEPTASLQENQRKALFCLRERVCFIVEQ
jgi:hypothetical protein